MCQKICRTSQKKILTWFGERVQAFRKNRYNPKFLLHSLENQNPISTTDSIVKVLYTTTIYDRCTVIICRNFVFMEKPKTINKSAINIRYSPTISSSSSYNMVHTMTPVTLNEFSTPLVCVQCGPNPVTHVNITPHNTQDLHLII